MALLVVAERSRMNLNEQEMASKEKHRLVSFVCLDDYTIVSEMMFGIITYARILDWMCKMMRYERK